MTHVAHIDYLKWPYTKPQLSPNKRMHWRQRAVLTKQLRNDAHVLGKTIRARGSYPTVTLHYRPARNGRRDADNLVMDAKAICDGLVDAGVAHDDTPQYMGKNMPVIHPAEGAACMWIEIGWSAT